MASVTYEVDDKLLRAKELASLYTKVGWNQSGDRTVTRVESILANSYCYVTARHDEMLVGFGRVLGDGFCGQVLDLMTHPEHRGRGIATEVMRRLMDAVSHRLVGICLIDGMGGDGGFYGRFGFQPADHATNRLMYFDPDERDAQERR